MLKFPLLHYLIFYRLLMHIFYFIPKSYAFLFTCSFLRWEEERLEEEGVSPVQLGEPDLPRLQVSRRRDRTYDQ